MEGNETGESQEAVEYRAVLNAPMFRVGSDGSMWSKLKHGCRGNEEGEWHLMSLFKVKSGHMRASLRYGDGPWVKKFIHTLILEAFTGPCPPGMECLHRDGDPQNNSLSNLRWGTRSENVRDAITHGTCNFSPGDRHSFAKITSRKAEQIRELLRDGQTQRAIARQFNVAQPTISAIARGERWA